jgi:hypothetical protein
MSALPVAFSSFLIDGLMTLARYGDSRKTMVRKIILNDSAIFIIPTIDYMTSHFMRSFGGLCY